VGGVIEGMDYEVDTNPYVGKGFLNIAHCDEEGGMG